MLAYFEAPPQEVDADREEGNPADQFDPEALSPADVPTRPRWIRLDYEASDTGTCVHSDCHLHLAGFPDTRVIVNGVPGPRQFVEMVFAWLYPAIYLEEKLAVDEDARRDRVIEINRVCLPIGIAGGYHPICFLSLPPSIRYQTLPVPPKP
jgi:hypothetical protein